MAKVAPLSGFPEWLPEQQLVLDEVLRRVRQSFELHGFAPLHLRSVEPLDTLLSKGADTDKEIYVLRRLHADEGDTADLGLHFDLTVPFARYVAQHQGALTFPYRRYQIQPAWRGERPQEGRYREFLQADVDIVGRDTLPVAHDVEMAGILAETLMALPIPPVTVMANNRKLIEGFYRGLGVEDVAGTLRVVDKLPKVGVDGVKKLLAHLPDGVVARILDLCTIATPDTSFVARVRALGVSHPLLDQGMDELAQVLDGNAHLPPGRLVAALHIARGLDYYTGTVYEGVMEGFEHVGAVCSGGRYDDLVDQAGGGAKFPGVGVSIGITRILGVLLPKGALTTDRSSPTCVLVALNSEEHRPAAHTLARQLRARGIAAEVASAPQKYGKQIRYAERKGIPYVWLHDAQGDGRHEVRDLRTSTQADADPQTWEPAPDRVRAHIRAT